MFVVDFNPRFYFIALHILVKIQKNRLNILDRHSHYFFDKIRLVVAVQFDRSNGRFFDLFNVFIHADPFVNHHVIIIIILIGKIDYILFGKFRQPV